MPASDAGALLADAAALARIGGWRCDLADDAISWTPGVFDMFGLPPHTRLDRREIIGMYDEESRDALERLRADAISRCGPFSMDVRIVRTDGAARWIRLTAEVVRRGGRATQLYGSKQDVTDEMARWEAMRRVAEHDALTGLSSRAVYQSRFLDGSRTEPGIAPLGALALLDLDGFKRVNDHFGHAAGDACLREIAARLSARFPDALMIARIGGDEFAVLIRAGGGTVAPDRRVALQLPHLSAPIFWRGEILRVGISAGVAAPDDPFAYDAEALFVTADAALYAAKSAGCNMVRVGAPAPEMRIGLIAG